jgi:hypothetical protein
MRLKQAGRIVGQPFSPLNRIARDSGHFLNGRVEWLPERATRGEEGINETRAADTIVVETQDPGRKSSGEKLWAIQCTGRLWLLL